MTSARKRRILVTRPQPAGDEFAEKLRREGFEAFVAPMTEYIETSVTVPDLAQYQALVFTSAQAVNILARHFAERYIPVFCVGDATAQTADAAGFRRVYSAQGDAQALAELIRSRRDQHHLKSILHVCGEDTAEDFADALKADGIFVERAPVYKAEFTDRLPDDILRAIEQGAIDTVTFFSARAAANFRHILEQGEGITGVAAHLEAVCLSDRVAAEVTGLPWKGLRIASAPQMESVMEILRRRQDGKTAIAAMPSAAVIEAFGGLRPLANRLDITASTVQGWKERGTIPEGRVDAVLQAAAAAGIDPGKLWTEEEGNSGMNDSSDGKKDDGKQTGASSVSSSGTPAAQAAAQATSERRRSDDRRRRYTAPDARGQISNEHYQGPDRRTGIDRRSYQQRQAERIAAEKWRFLNRSFVMTGFFLLCGVYVAGFLLAPEFFDLRRKSESVTAMQAQVNELNARIAAMQKQQQGELLGLENKLQEQELSFGQRLSAKIGELEKAAADATGMTGQAVGMATSAVTAVSNAAVDAAGTTELGKNIGAFMKVLSNLSTQSKTKEGQDSLARGFERLRGVLATAPRDGTGLNAAVFTAMKGDSDLAKMLSGVEARDLGAAALLLALNEFRSNISAQRSFEQDLLIMQKYLGDDPKMKKALARLAPYAQHGVLNRQQLQKEFGNLASDIVMAKMQGQDLSVKQEMLKRLSKLVKVRKIDDIEGTSVDATVARAQLKLNNGDVKGAMKELQSLEGAPAQTAAPFMDAAAGNLMAEDTTQQLLQNVLSQFSPTGSAAEGADLNQLFQDIWNQGPNGLMPYISGGARDTSVTQPYVGPDVVNSPRLLGEE